MEKTIFQPQTNNMAAIASRMLSEIMPKNVRVLSGKRRTKPTIFDDQRVMVCLAYAFAIGANQTEASAFAGCSRTAIKKHLHDGTMIEYSASRYVEPLAISFKDLVALWQCPLLILCKMAIYNDIINPHTGTKSAWRLLERQRPEEWGDSRRRRREGVRECVTV